MRSAKRSQRRRRTFDAAQVMLWLVFLVPPFVISLGAHDTFRMPKLLVTECLGVASLMAVLLRLRTVGKIDARKLLRHAALLATVPLFLVAASTVFTSAHPLHARQALVSFGIAAACTLGWSLGFTAGELERCLRRLIWPATVLALGAIFQYHVFNPFDFTGQVDERIALTSLAGGAFDLAAYLLLPILIAQLALWQGRGRRWAWGLALLICVYALALTQTLSALLAVALATLVLWFPLVPRRLWMGGLAVVVVVGAALVLGITPLRERAELKVIELTRGELNHVLTGRLDAWRAALWMLEEHPVTGVGLGGYRAEFGKAKLALVERGIRFDRQLQQVYFTNAHNEVLDVGAELGALGLLALGWGIANVLRASRRRAASGREEGHGALVAAGLAGMSLLVLVNFPFHLAIVAYPLLLFVSWICASPAEEKEAEA